MPPARVSARWQARVVSEWRCERVEIYWLEQRQAEVAEGNRWLSEDERATLARLRIPKRREDWRLGRWTAKLAVARFLRLPEAAAALAAIEVRPAPSGAPRAFVDGLPAGVSLSLSHSEGVGFCVLGTAGAALGCDVEKVTPHSPAFLADFFTAGERQLVAGWPAIHRDALLTLLWSGKESVLKALECGLRQDTRSVAVHPGDIPRFADDGWQFFRACLRGGRQFQGWWRTTGDLVRTLVADRITDRLQSGEARGSPDDRW
jgi:4'-phosphopantetheinyl transferase